MQAVSRKAEGIEPRNCETGKEDALQLAELNTWLGVVAAQTRFPGVGDHGMHDTMSVRQPGRPRVCFSK